MIKKILSAMSTLAIALVLVLSVTNEQAVEARVSDIPYNTYSIGLKGELVNTATAYEGTFILNAGFNEPQDIYIDDQDVVYVADSGNGRIYIYNPKTREEREIGVGVLQNPTGVFVDAQGDIYVADAKLNEVLWFTSNGTLMKTYGRPDEPLFGDTAPYLPRKVIVSSNKDVYIISESGVNGIIQMNMKGDFLGYYGVNTVELSLSLLFRRALMSQAQKDQFASLAPKSSTNFARDAKGIIYTVIGNEYANPIKKLNIEGNNILTGRLLPDPGYQDIFIDDKGLIYVISNSKDTYGAISILDQNGDLIFTFGERKAGSLKIGQFEDPSGIAVDSNGDIWVLDKTGKNVQVFTKTEFANLVLTAIDYHNNSNYEQSEVLFEEVVRQNAMFALAHSSLGKVYERKGDLEQALESYRIANDKEGYSDIYWELRDEWIEEHLIKTIALLLVIGVGVHFFNKYKHSIKGYEKVDELKDRVKKTQGFHEVSLLRRMLKNPNDVVYEIKFRQSVRIRTAIILYVIFIFLNIITNYYVLGYLFRGNTDDMVLSFEIFKYLLPLLLIGVANYLINSLQSGEGFYRDIFIGLIYACAPIFIFKLPIDILSNVLTHNESFLMSFSYTIMWAWTAINVILVIKEVNNYKPVQLIVNLILTAFTMMMIIIIYLVINVLTTQMWSFIQGILQEVFL